MTYGPADLAADATEYRVHVPDGGGITLLIKRRIPGPGPDGWAASTTAVGGGRAWTTEGWQDEIGALSVNRLYCWPDAPTALAAITQALAVDLDAAPDFFRPGQRYSSQDGFTAPEAVWSFDCRHTTTTPDGRRIAFGFVRVGDEDGWTPTGLGDEDWDRREWRA